MLITSGCAALALPMVAVLAWALGIGYASSQAEAAGAAIGGFVVTGAVGLVSLFVGGFLLVIGLLVGRDPLVIYVDRTAENKN